MADSKVTFDILARDKASRAFGTVGRSADKTHRKLDRFRGLGGVFARVGKAAALGLGAGIAGAAYALKGFVQEAEESRKISRLTAQVIKTTGKAANVSAKQVDKLSESLSNKSGIDDEAIQNGANLLLTFKNIRNEVGKNNKIFDKATETALDMSVALDQDMKSSAIQLGKALNDPIKGITALTRVGVSFTEEQKEQIKTLVESGRTMEAQKVILSELQSEFGGAAAAASSPWQRLMTVLGNVKETIGTALLPFVDKAATWLGEKLPGAVEKSVKWFKRDLWPALKDFGSGVGKGVLGFFANFAEQLGIGGDGATNFKRGAKGLGDTLTKVVLPAIGKLAEKTLPALGTAMGNGVELTLTLADAFIGMARIGHEAFSDLTKTALNSFGSILEGLQKITFGPLGNRVDNAAERFDRFRERTVSNLDRTESKLDELKDALDRIRSKNITVGVNYVTTGPFSGKALPIDGARANGGPMKAGGAYLVGERGPEIVTPNRSGFVHDAKTSARMGGITINGGITIQGADAREALAELPRRLSNMQFALGRA